MARSGFKHEVVIERDHDSCQTIRLNQGRRTWPVGEWKLIQDDVALFDYAANLLGMDLVAGDRPSRPVSSNCRKLST